MNKNLTMTTLTYHIDDTTLTLDATGSPEFAFGKNKVLASAETDIAYHQPWYIKGYTAQPFMSEDEFTALKAGITETIKKIISETQSKGDDLKSFTLENYHQFVTTDEAHLKIVTRTRDLFANDFNFNITEHYDRLSKILGFKITDINPANGKIMHIILRINRPQSTDYNPPHKDIYQAVDGALPRILSFINFWIPICGVNEHSSLAIIEGSHRLPESQIERTFAGGVINGHTYRIRTVKSWGGDNRLIRTKVKQGEVLIFSSHLIHGLAYNAQSNTTRVSLEFRLFKQGNDT